MLAERSVASLAFRLHFRLDSRYRLGLLESLLGYFGILPGCSRNGHIDQRSSPVTSLCTGVPIFKHVAMRNVLIFEPSQ